MKEDGVTVGYTDMIYYQQFEKKGNTALLLGGLSQQSWKCVGLLVSAVFDMGLDFFFLHVSSYV